ncbi:MAG: helix-turn-helix domain-containing protein [Pseudodonghicola sp.]
MPHLPASMIHVAEVLGVRVALGLMQHFGGREMRIPIKMPDPDHPIVKALGEDDARALCQYMADEVIYVPHGRIAARQRAVLDLRSAGRTRGDIARLLGLSERHVRRIENGSSDPRQGDLFFEED